MSLNRYVFGSLLLMMMALFIAPRFHESSDTGDNQGIEMVPNVVVVKFKRDFRVESNGPQTADIEINNLIAAHGIISLDPVAKNKSIIKSTANIYDISNIYYASFSGKQSPIEVAAELEKNPQVLYAEPKYIHYINAIPNDSLYFHQQIYYNIIKAPQAWDIIKGEAGKAIIAIIDGGTDIQHPDLLDNIWTNEQEMNGIPGTDDDGNGYIDDLYGWNFANDSGDPTGLDSTPKNGDHGTFTAGIVSSISNNFTGVSGISWNAIVMAINAGSNSTDRAIADGYEGIIYAADNGADIINCSWGGYHHSMYEEDVIQYANSRGAVVITAAGNDNTDQPFYPSAYDNALSVAGTDNNDDKWSGSNYGKHIDIAAPAESIYSTLADGRYGYATGTSLSAPLVAGIIGLVKAQNPDWSGVQAGELVRLTADSILDYAGQMGRGRLNAYRALTERSPAVRVLDYNYIDENSNGFIEPGERIEMYLTIINYLAAAKNISITLSSSSDYITMIENVVSLSSIHTNEQITLPDPFVFDVAKYTPGLPLIKFELQIIADGYTDQDRFTFEQISPKIIWTKHPDNPIFTGGEHGSWNRHTLWPTVLFNKDSTRYEMWYCASKSFDDLYRPMRIGFATSLDGIKWEKHPTPVLDLGEAGTWDEYTVEEPRVIRDENTGQYKMWYISFKAGPPAMIGYANSSDGIHWVKDTLNNPVMVPGSDDWQISGFTAPHVLPFEGGYKMWYTGWGANWSSSNIGYATSPDGIIWIPDSVHNPVLTTGGPGQWDDTHLECNQVLYIDNVYHMWYTGTRRGESHQQTGYATSDDGIHWNKYNDANTTSTLYMNSDPVLRLSSGEWDGDCISQGTVMLKDDTLRMWYSGVRNPLQSNLVRIGYAKTPYTVTNVFFENSDILVSNHSMLHQNYPNPFNPSTTIEFNLPKSEFVELKVFNILGKEVSNLESKKLNQGNHTYTFDGTNLASGIYYYQLVAAGYREVKKMLLIK